MANTAVVYGRDYAGQTLNFEASGGLTNASLVMQDQQTDTFWSLMKGKALAGKLTGQVLKELTVSEKTTWQAWKSKHPTTKILSVNSMQDGANPYREYFRDPSGFRGMEAKDQRLETKSPIFAFHHAGKTYAAAYADIESGVSFELPTNVHLFLFREPGDEIFRSTTAFISTSGFQLDDHGWTESSTAARFDPSSRSFASELEKLNGFDTFWYNWSLNNPETELLSKIAGDKD